ncbi:MAG: hypothetical protein JSV41_02925, partial [Gemmatimonadota bacterium]
MGDRSAVPEQEIYFQATRSSGPGGQHANRRATRVEACWNVQESPGLTEEERSRILEKLASRIGRDGVLRVVAEDERSQHRNKNTAMKMLRAALYERAMEERRKEREKIDEAKTEIA